MREKLGEFIFYLLAIGFALGFWGIIFYSAIEGFANK